MSLNLPRLSKSTVSYQSLTAGLQTFLWKDLTNISEIGKGSFGSVFSASFYNKHTSTPENVVVKKLLSSSRKEEKQRFFKEARLLHSLDHENVVCFKMVCIEPPAIMMEFVLFDFKPFCAEEEKQVHNLEDFLGFLDETDATEAFSPDLYRKIALDVANGLQYLHASNVYHRDLKTSNVLVSNSHYRNINHNDELTAVFKKVPIVCKLTDFGESRSEHIQTQLLANTRTKNVDRGTPSFVAPEVHTLKEASAEDLKSIDMWAYGMIIYFCLQLINYRKGLNKSKNFKIID